METAIRVRSGTIFATLVRSETAIARSSLAFDYAGIDGEEIDKKPKTIR